MLFFFFLTPPPPSEGEGNGTPLQYSCLENPMDGGGWCPAVHGVTRSRTRLSNFTFTFHFPALDKEMATHSSVLAWRIPGMGEPGGLPSMGSHRVRHDWSDLAAAATVRISHFPSSQLFLFFFIIIISHFLRSFWHGPFFKFLLNLLQDCFHFIFQFFGYEACGILASWPGIELTPLC